MAFALAYINQRAVGACLLRAFGGGRLAALGGGSGLDLHGKIRREVLIIDGYFFLTLGFKGVLRLHLKSGCDRFGAAVALCNRKGEPCGVELFAHRIGEFIRLFGDFHAGDFNFGGAALRAARGALGGAFDPYRKGRGELVVIHGYFDFALGVELSAGIDFKVLVNILVAFVSALVGSIHPKYHSVGVEPFSHFIGELFGLSDDFDSGDFAFGGAFGGGANVLRVAESGVRVGLLRLGNGCVPFIGHQRVGVVVSLRGVEIAYVLAVPDSSGDDYNPGVGEIVAAGGEGEEAVLGVVVNARYDHGALRDLVYKLLGLGFVAVYEVIVVPDGSVLAVSVGENYADDEPFILLVKAVELNYRVLFIERELAVFVEIGKHLSVVIDVVSVDDKVGAAVVRIGVAAVIEEGRSVHGVVAVVVAPQVILPL